MSFLTLLEKIPFPLLQYFSVQDLLVLSGKDEYINSIILTIIPHLTFYGYPLPNVMDRNNQMFYDLFLRRYEALEQNLVEDKDNISLSCYGLNKTIRKRLSAAFILWNEMTLLEIAYLLHDEDAIELLLKHDRTICHEIASYTSSFGKKAIILAVQAGDKRVVSQLWSQIHIYNQESLQREFPMIFGHFVTGCQLNTYIR